MSRVRFHAGDVDLELSGSEPFVLRQLKLLCAFLGRVDPDALGETDAPARTVDPEPAVVAEPPAPAAPALQALPVAAAPVRPVDAAPAPARPTNGGSDAREDLLAFYSGFQPSGLDRQSDAALLFAYYLQQREGMPSLRLGDLIRCCIRAGVDTRNFNRTLGTLTRRGYLEAVQPGHAYRLSDQGVAAVESRM